MGAQNIFAKRRLGAMTSETTKDNPTTKSEVIEQPTETEVKTEAVQTSPLQEQISKDELEAGLGFDTSPLGEKSIEIRRTVEVSASKTDRLSAAKQLLAGLKTEVEPNLFSRQEKTMEDELLEQAKIEAEEQTTKQITELNQEEIGTRITQTTEVNIETQSFNSSNGETKETEVEMAETKEVATTTRSFKRSNEVSEKPIEETTPVNEEAKTVKSFNFHSKTVNVEPPPVSVPEEEHNSSRRFRQGNEAQRLKLKGEAPAIIIDKGVRERKRLLTYVHYLKFITPLFNRISIIGEPNQQVELLQNWLRNANMFALQTIELLGKYPSDPNVRWLQNTLERIYIDYAVAEVNDITNTEYKPELATKLFQLVQSNPDFFEFKDNEERFNDVPEMNLELTLLFLSHVNQVSEVYNRFSLYMKEEFLTSRFIEFLQGTADEYFYQKISEKSLLSGKDKLIYYKVIAKEITQTFITSWKKHSNIFVVEQKNAEIAGQENYVEDYLSSHPNGYPIELIFDEVRTRLQQVDQVIQTIVRF